MSCTHEMKQGAVVTVVSNPNGPAGCMLCENARLRTALEKIASVFCESTPGMMAERALMTDEQRAAFDAMRSSPSGGAAPR